MALCLRVNETSSICYLSAGFESGHCILFCQNLFDSSTPTSSPCKPLQWLPVYVSKAHAQPILGLDISIRLDCFYTAGADSIVAKHPLISVAEGTPSRPPPLSEPLQSIQTKHSGQTCLRIRTDDTIFATAGWDSRVRVYAAQGMGELAVLKWHKAGLQCVAFAEILDADSIVAPVNQAPEAGAPDGRALTRKTEGSVAMTKVSQRRSMIAGSTHWLAAGGKDCKISLWEVY